MKKSLFLLVTLIAISACNYTPAKGSKMTRWGEPMPPSTALTSNYTPVQGRIMTPWGEKMTSSNTWMNYPRPNMVRSEWTNLNGLWQFAVTKINEEMPKDENWQQAILVPFAPESALSGVGRLTEPDETLWYKRTFEIAEVKKGIRYFLNFEAVDWRCQVFVNGFEATAAPHIGGNVPFSVEVTDLVKEGENTLVVTAWDPSNSYGQPTGKQSLNPGGCFYTRVSGIYGSVWMETTPKGYITGYNVESDIDKGEAKVTVSCAGDLAGAKVTAEVSFGGEKVAEGEIADWSKGLTLSIPEPKLWDINEGNLYDLTLTLETAFGKDEVKGYFGMRKIEFKKDELGVQRIYLNNKKIFMQGTLDQGWWPDGLLTPPSDEAMQYDIDILKEHGFNFMRKHIKIEPRRYYYLCDKAGFPVWQDMVSGGQKPEEKYHIYRAELAEMIKDLRNFPSIVVWIAYNEGWGQPDKEKSVETTKWLKQIDTTRLISETSGWTDHHAGDMKDHHQYPSPLPTPKNDDRLTIVGEFGGLGLFVEGHLWDPEKKWGYRSDANVEDSLKRYAEIMDNLARTSHESFAGSVYTQTTDVETEANGLVTYDRKVVKYPTDKMREMHKRVEKIALSTKPMTRKCFMPKGTEEKVVWKYTFKKPKGKWSEASFNDDSWKEGEGGFGNKVIIRDLGAKPKTEWDTDKIYLRRVFMLKEVPDENIEMDIFYDEDPVVYVNGVEVFKQEGYNQGYTPVLLKKEEVKKVFKKGENVIAIGCKNKNGGAMIDVGFYSELKLED